MTVDIPAPLAPKRFIIPDLVSHCNFPLTCQPNAESIAVASDRWLDEGCPELDSRKRTALFGLRSGILTAHCYPDADDEHLRVVADFLVYLFHLDNISDKMQVQGTEQLADVVMNAHWLPERYAPTSFPGKEQPAEEFSAGRMARE